eukprot:TRINITY_DN9474_c0_g1_i1.p1 TRINITY_DN9474_c0_g1~~TRINITY_DN9474_c0_g1_i1.p1  ORF type:complete len:324 (+),score=57.44 TRINITY_DN9474_c0_g1_i1:48-1019(+)
MSVVVLPVKRIFVSDNQQSRLETVVDIRPPEQIRGKFSDDEYLRALEPVVEIFASIDDILNDFYCHKRKLLIVSALTLGLGFVFGAGCVLLAKSKAASAQIIELRVQLATHLSKVSSRDRGVIFELVEPDRKPGISPDTASECRIQMTISTVAAFSDTPTIALARPATNDSLQSAARNPILMRLGSTDSNHLSSAPFINIIEPTPPVGQVITGAVARAPRKHRSKSPTRRHSRSAEKSAGSQQTQQQQPQHGGHISPTRSRSPSPTQPRDSTQSSSPRYQRRVSGGLETMLANGPAFPTLTTTTAAVHTTGKGTSDMDAEEET